MKKKKIIVVSIVLVIIIILALIILLTNRLLTNKTFFKNVYIGVNNQEIFIPKYSYFNKECCMTAASFYSLRSEKELKEEINNYMSGFEYFSEDTTYGYKKGDLFIQSYEVINNGLYRTIIITY